MAVKRPTNSLFLQRRQVVVEVAAAAAGDLVEWHAAVLRVRANTPPQAQGGLGALVSRCRLGLIGATREQGAFDNLPGAGKPLPYLGQEYDPDWWVKQLVQREQISILPPSLELLRKVEKELAAIENLHDEATVRRRVSALNVEIAKVNATVLEGPPTRLVDATRLVSHVQDRPGNRRAQTAVQKPLNPSKNGEPRSSLW